MPARSAARPIPANRSVLRTCRLDLVLGRAINRLISLLPCRASPSLHRCSASIRRPPFRRYIVYPSIVYCLIRPKVLAILLVSAVSPLSYLDDSKIKRVLILPCPTHPAHRLALGKPIQPQHLHQRPRYSPNRTASSVRMMMTRRHAIGRYDHATCPLLAGTAGSDAGSDTGRLLHSSALVSQRCTSSAAHVTISTEVGDFECGHLAGDLPQVTDGEE